MGTDEEPIEVHPVTFQPLSFSPVDFGTHFTFSNDQEFEDPPENEVEKQSKEAHPAGKGGIKGTPTEKTDDGPINET